MWDPFQEIDRMRKEMNRMFRDFFDRPERHLIGSGKPLVQFKQPLSDVQENGKEVIVNLDIPGVDKKDIVLTVKDDILEIKAEKKHEAKIEKKDFYQHERGYAGFYRALLLPTNVKVEEANAEYKNGVLRIVLPKSEKEKRKGKIIGIK